MADLHVTWDEYHRLIERLARQVDQSGWQFNQLICIARGGLRVGDVLSRIFDMPLAILSTSSYTEKAGTIRGELMKANSSLRSEIFFTCRSLQSMPRALTEKLCRSCRAVLFFNITSCRSR